MTRTGFFRIFLLRAAVLAALSGLALPGLALEVKPEFVPSSKAQEDARRKAEDRARALEQEKQRMSAEKQKADEEVRQLKAQLETEKQARLKAEKARQPEPAKPPAVAPAYAPATPLSARQKFKDCADCPEMVVIPADSFMRGSPKNEADRHSDEGPQQRVSVGTFALARTEVTQGQWKAVMGNNPSHFKSCGDDCPVENVSWDDAQAYLRKLSQKTGKTYHLPSEAQWEYAARAGTTTPFSTGQTITTDQANFDGNYTYNGSAKGVYRKTTIKVGSFAPNAFGLYDMSGNVWEWVQDRWHDNYQGAPTDGTAWESGTDVGRVLRGGSWYNAPQFARSAIRVRSEPANRDNHYGFRPARMLP